MKILQLVPSLSAKAPVEFSVSLARALKSLGHSVDICYLKDVEGGSVNVSCIDTFKISMSTMHKLSHYDVIHSHMLLPNILSMFFSANGKVATIHSDIWKDLTDSHNSFIAYFAAKLWLRSLTKQNKCIVISPFHRELYSKYLNRLHFIPNGIDSSLESKALNYDVNIKISNFYLQGSTYFSVGAFRPLKGLEQILKLLIVERSKRCVFFGDGPLYNDIVNMSKSLGVFDRCLFLGFVSNPYFYFDYCDCLLLTSHSEGFPLSLLEGARASVRVVVSDIPAYKGIFEEKLIKYELDNISSLKRSIEYAFECSNYASELNRIYLDNYTLCNVASKYVLAFKEIRNE